MVANRKEPMNYPTFNQAETMRHRLGKYETHTVEGSPSKGYTLVPRPMVLTPEAAEAAAKKVQGEEIARQQAAEDLMDSLVAQLAASGDPCSRALAADYPKGTEND